MSLDEKTLQRLAIDRALGGLSDDAKALLEAYLGHDNRAQALADEIAETVDLAKKTVKGPGKLRLRRLPPLPSVAGRVAVSSSRRPKIFRQMTALAGCVLLGLGIGTWLPKDVPEPTAPLVIRVFDPPQSRTDSQPSEIWSVERFLKRAARTGQSSSTGYVWDLHEMKLKRKGDPI